MMKQLIGFIILFLLILFSGFKSRNQAYIDKWAAMAKQLHFETGVPASVQLAQAIYESGAGTSKIAVEGNAHFGIRYFKEHWQGSSVAAKGGTLYRAYSSVEEGYLDHACFLSDHYEGAIGKPWQHWVKYGTGYGGSSDYWQQVGSIIKQQKLYKYD